MVLGIYSSSIALSLVLLLPLAWKWGIPMRMAFISAPAIGGAAGFITAWIAPSFNYPGLAVLLFIELALILLITALAIVLRFYRDPERSPVETDRVILSPADGRIIYVNQVEEGASLVSTKGERRFRLEEITATDLLTDVRYLVGIEMNVLNVHVNRSPIRGRTVFQKHVKGRFMSLRKQESEIENERVTTIIDSGQYRVGVVQIASRLVRRIVSYIKEGDNLEIGQRIGAILFGSQVDVLIPVMENIRIEVKPSDEVKAGISVIARYG